MARYSGEAIDCAENATRSSHYQIKISKNLFLDAEKLTISKVVTLTMESAPAGGSMCALPLGTGAGLMCAQSPT